MKGASFSSVFLAFPFGVGVSCHARLTLSLVNGAGLCCILGQDQSTRWYLQMRQAVKSGGNPLGVYSAAKRRLVPARYDKNNWLQLVYNNIVVEEIDDLLLLLIYYNI